MATKKTTEVKVVTPQDLVQGHEANVLKSLQVHKLNQSMFVDFPNRKRIPILGLLGVWLVNKMGGVIATKYKYVGGTINSNSRRKK